MTGPAPDPLHATDSLPRLDASLGLPSLDARPALRGWIHAGMVPLAAVLGAILVVVADGRDATIGAAVFAVASFLLFTTSAIYHRLARDPRLRLVLRRLDHANIFLLIAGTYTPISVLCLPPERWVPLLAVVWSGAVLGIGFRVFWIGAPRWLYVPIYVALGWVALLYVGDLFAVSPIAMSLVLAGGVFYSLGAAVYGLKRPDPLPAIFGFHEVFHSLTVLAFLCHWIAVVLVATDPPAL